MRPLPLNDIKSIPEALLAVGAGVPARRAGIERAAHAGRSAVHAGAAALGNAGDLVGNRLVDRSDRHGLSGRHHQANGERGCSNYLHECFLIPRASRDAANSGLRTQHGRLVTPDCQLLTSDDGANDGDAIPSDAGASVLACASDDDGPSGPPLASDDRLRPVSRRLIRGRHHGARGPLPATPAIVAPRSQPQQKRSYQPQFQRQTSRSLYAAFSFSAQG